MKDAQDHAILNQIRVLLNQLELKADMPQSLGTHQQNCGLTEKLLQMSCDRYWVYDPTTNSVEIFMYDVQNHRNSRITRSLTSLQNNTDTDNRRVVAVAFERMLNQTSVEETFEYVEFKNGKTNVYEIAAHAWDVDGHLKIIGTTHIHQDAMDMQEIKQKYDLLLGLSNMYIWEYDVRRKQFSGNHSLCVKLGIEERMYSIEELEEKIHVYEMENFIHMINHNEQHEKAIVHVQNRASSYESTFETNFRSVCDNLGNCVSFLGIMIDVTEHEMLKAMASKDTLTGCYNRNMADVTLEQNFKKFMSNGDAYTIIFFDIDKFKTVNDRYGHDMGDYVLKSVCEHIEKEIRSNDMMFRWGGDEFLLLCRGIAKENIYGYIDRLRKIIEIASFEFKDTKLQLTISIGAAIFYKSDTDYNNAMKRADRSLYKAKLAGRNKVCILK